MNKKVDSTAHEQQLCFSRIEKLSDLMLKEAGEEQWETVTDLQIDREEKIRVFFAEKIEMDLSKLAAGIQYILKCDQKLTKLGEKQRKTLQQQIYKMKQGKNAVKAYTV